MEFISSQLIAITVDVLDRCSLVNCDAVIRTQFNWIRFTVSYSLLCKNLERIIWIVIYLLGVVFESISSQW